MAFDLDVAIVRPVPPIDRFEDIDLTPIEMKSGYRDPVIVRIELNSNTHDLCGPDPLHLKPSNCGSAAAA